MENVKLVHDADNRVNAVNVYADFPDGIGSASTVLVTNAKFRDTADCLILGNNVSCSY